MPIAQGVFYHEEHNAELLRELTLIDFEQQIHADFHRRPGVIRVSLLLEAATC